MGPGVLGLGINWQPAGATDTEALRQWMEPGGEASACCGGFGFTSKTLTQRPHTRNYTQKNEHTHTIIVSLVLLDIPPSSVQDSGGDERCDPKTFTAELCTCITGVRGQEKMEQVGLVYLTENNFLPQVTSRRRAQNGYKAVILATC